MDLIKVCLPSTIEVEGIFYPINTDFRAWIVFSRLLYKENVTLVEFDYLYLNDKPLDRQKGFEKLLEFFAPKKELPRAIGGGNGERVIDYDLDAELIYSAFMQVYKIDLLATDKKGRAIPLHWHKFTALLNGLTGTKLNDVMGYRSYNENDKSDYNKQLINMRNAWRLPAIETAEDRKAREEFNALFDVKN